MNLKDVGLRSDSKWQLGSECGFLFSDLKKERDNLQYCYLEELVLVGGRFPTKNAKFVIRISFRLSLEDDLHKSNITISYYLSCSNSPLSLL